MSYPRKRFPRSQRFTHMFSHVIASAFALRSVTLWSWFPAPLCSGPISTLFHAADAVIPALSAENTIPPPTEFSALLSEDLKICFRSGSATPTDRHACHYRTGLSLSPHHGWGPGWAARLPWAAACSLPSCDVSAVVLRASRVVMYSQLFFSRFCNGWAPVLCLIKFTSEATWARVCSYGKFLNY